MLCISFSYLLFISALIAPFYSNASKFSSKHPETCPAGSKCNDIKGSGLTHDATSDSEDEWNAGEDDLDDKEAWWSGPDRRTQSEYIEQETSRGTLLINMGHYKDAIGALTANIATYPNAFEFYVARGSAYAMEGNLSAARTDMDRAIELNPYYADSYIRRGQIRSALGDVKGYQEDMSKADDLTKTVEERANVNSALVGDRAQHEIRNKNFTGAVLLLKEGLKSAEQSKDPELINQYQYQIGKCYSELGDIQKARKILNKVIEHKNDDAAALSEMGQVMKELQNFNEADDLFTRALLVSDHSEGEGLPSEAVSRLTELRQARARHWMGELIMTIDCTKAALPHHNRVSRLEIIYYLAGSYHGLGQFPLAIEFYNKGLRRHPFHFLYYLREIASAHHRYFDTPLSEYYWDRVFSPQFKECWGMRRDTNECLPKNYIEQSTTSGDIPTLDLNKPLSTGQQKLHTLAVKLGSRIQYHTPGFLPNRKHFRSSGIAIIQLAQMLKKHAQLLSKDKKSKGLMLDGRASSPYNSTAHSLNWRDLFDIIVRWRQAVEPLDPVWWIDQLTRSTYEQGYGTTTPLTLGQTKNIRYYPYYESTVNLLKYLVPMQHKLDEDKLYQVVMARKIEDIYSILGTSMTISTPCYSSTTPGKILEGSKLLLGPYREGPGLSLEISTSATPSRWETFDKELSSAFKNITRLLQERNPSLNKIYDVTFKLAYYWFNFMPLSRGSAAAGMTVIHAVLLAFGYELKGEIPRGMQVDWEAMIRSRPEAFMNAIERWYLADGKISKIDYDVIKNLPLVSEEILTLRDIFRLVNDGMTL